MTDRNKKQYPIERILRSPDGEISSTQGIGGILARLWRQILKDRAVSPGHFEILLDQFIVNAKRGIPEHRVSRHFTRGNLRRELEKQSMTFKVFMKGMKFLKITRINFAVELFHSNGDRSLHQTTIDLGSPQISEEFANDTKGQDTDE